MVTRGQLADLYGRKLPFLMEGEIQDTAAKQRFALRNPRRAILQQGPRTFTANEHVLVE